MTQLFAARDIPTADEVNSLMVNRYVKMTPTSVGGTGVSINSTGTVVMSNATAVVVNGCFNTTFRAYDVIYDSRGTAATAAFYLRVAGTTSITNYDLTEIAGRAGAVVSSTAVAQPAWVLAPVAQTRHATNLRIYAPGLATPTAATIVTGAHANPAVSSTANFLRQMFGTHRLSVQYDGLLVEFSAAQTGTLSIFGVY